MSSDKQQQAPVGGLCVKGCGFWGSAMTLHMCSVCYRRHCQERSNPDQVESDNTAGGSSAVATPSEALVDPKAETSVNEKPVQKDPKKCWSCKRRVGLLGFRCRCDYVFCSKHRHSDSHNCQHDYKTSARAKLQKANPVVVRPKVQQI